MRAGPMRSPATAMGTAGGQATVGAPHTRPRACAAATVSQGRNMASRMEHTASPLAWGRGRRGLGGLLFSPRQFRSRSKSVGGFSGVHMHTRSSRSQYSHSTPPDRSRAARSPPAALFARYGVDRVEVLA